MGLDATFSALGDPTRRAILGVLSLGQASVSELARPHKISLPAVMKHLRVLEQAGLVTQTKTGRVRHCRLAAKPLLQASDWLSGYEMFWQTQFDHLDRYLKESQPKEEQACHPPKQHRRKPQRPARS